MFIRNMKSMEIAKVNLSKIKPNPNNPRVIKDDKFAKLVKSIKEFPEMLKIRPIVVNSDMVVLGGNMRLKACKEAGLKEVYIIKADELTEQQQKEFIIKDNVGFGEWDWDMLANEWDAEKLDNWGLDVPIFENEEPIQPSGYDQESQWFLNIRCENEQQTQQLYERFLNEGLDVKIVT